MSLRSKILTLGFVAILGMFFTLWFQYRSYSTQAQAIETVTRNVKVVGALSQATHELQKERGLTTIKQASTSGQALAEQRSHTDEVLSKLAGTGIRIAGLDDTLGRLRVMAASDTANRFAIRDGYTKLLQTLIDEMGRLTHESDTSVARADVTAHSHLMKAKEYLGRTRATVGYEIGLKRDDPSVINSLIRLKSIYDEEVRMFELAASPELREASAAPLSGNELAKTLHAVTQIVATGKFPQELAAQTWWSLATAAIDRLKSVEDHSLHLIEQKAEGELARSRNAMNLGVVVTLGVGLAAFMLALSTTVTLLAEKLLNEKDFLATTDALTGINNRMRFGIVLDEEAGRKRRNKMPMSLIMFDIDHFKRINDEHGHNTGDEILKALSSLVSKEIRFTDFFCRWGGEEFILLLKDDGCDAAIVAAEKIRSLIEAADFPTVGKVTCSFGVAHWKQDDTEISLVARADKALYESKNEGRNRVRCPQGDWKNCPGRDQCAHLGGRC